MERRPPAHMVPCWRQCVQTFAGAVGAADLAFIGGIFLASRILLILATLVAAPLAHPAFLGGPPLPPFTHSWQRWDAIHYAAIAQRGYPSPDNAHLAAFFPLFPLLEHLVAVPFGGDVALAGLVIAQVAWFVALVLLAALARQDRGRAVGRCAVIALSAFPTACFGFVAYPEALFLALALGTFLLLRRGQWWWAGMLGFLAALTRQAGLLLLLPFLWEYGRLHGWDWHRFRADLLASLAFPGGIAFFALLLWRAVGDPLAFLHAQATWHRFWSPPGITLLLGWHAIFSQPMPYFTFRAIQEWLTTVGMLVLALRGAARFPAAYTVFALPLLMLFLAQPASDWPLLSQSRFALELFPLFIVLGDWLAGHRWRRYGYIALCLPLQLLFIAIFSRGGWMI